MTEPLDPTPSTYYARPYSVIYGERFAASIKQTITDPAVKRIKTDIGSIDQFTDSTTIMETLALGKKLRGLYDKKRPGFSAGGFQEREVVLLILAHHFCLLENGLGKHSH